MDIIECIETRRSVRKYKADSIPEEQLERVLQAVQWAPSWMNLQPWEIVVVDDPALKAALQEFVPVNNPGRGALVAAPVVLAVCGRQGCSGYYNGEPSTMHGDWVMFDIGIACENLCLAAWSLGLGSLHLGLLDHRRAGEVLGLPQDVCLYELIPLGIPAKLSNPPPRRNVQEFVHRNKW